MCIRQLSYNKSIKMSNKISFEDFKNIIKQEIDDRFDKSWNRYFFVKENKIEVEQEALIQALKKGLEHAEQLINKSKTLSEIKGLKYVSTDELDQAIQISEHGIDYFVPVIKN